MKTVQNSTLAQVTVKYRLSTNETLEELLGKDYFMASCMDNEARFHTRIRLVWLMEKRFDLSVFFQTWLAKIPVKVMNICRNL